MSRAPLQDRSRIVALSGGIGGAKLALGLKRVLPRDALVVIANTGDDFEHFGLHISPDIDTLVYTLADLSDPTRGWGRQDETWTFMSAVDALGGETWFNLGDGDLALHVLRTMRLKREESLSAITADVCDRLGVGALILPMSDQPVRTRLHTDAGQLDFQDYFVRLKTGPAVRAIDYVGADTARPSDGLLDILSDPATMAIVLCPSNPFISIDPILAVPGIRAALQAAHAPVIGVSPVIAGQSVKGPTARMMTELGSSVSAASVLARYGDLLDGFLVDPRDIDAVAPYASDIACVGTDIMMRTDDDRDRVALAVLALADQLRAPKQAQGVRRPGAEERGPA